MEDCLLLLARHLENFAQFEGLFYDWVEMYRAGLPKVIV